MPKVDLLKPWVYDSDDQECLKTVDGDVVCYGGDIGGFTDDAYGKLAAAAPQLLKALKSTLRAYYQLMPGLAHISVQDYANINEAPIEAHKVIDMVEA